MNNDILKIITYLTLLELDIENLISKEMVIDAYKKLSKVYHPDVANNRYKDGKKFIELQQAKNYLIENISYVNSLIMAGFSSFSSNVNNDYAYEKWKQEQEFKQRKAEEDRLRREREEAERKKQEELRIKREAEQKKRQEEERLEKHINESLSYLKTLQEGIKDKYLDADLKVIDKVIYELYQKISNRDFTTISDIDKEIKSIKEKIEKFKTLEQIEKEKIELETKKQAKRDKLNACLNNLNPSDYRNDDYLVFQNEFRKINDHISNADKHIIDSVDKEILEFQAIVAKTKTVLELKKIAAIKKRIKIGAVSSLLIICLICLIFFIIKVPLPYFRYNNAIKLAENHNYQQAYEVFNSLDNYKESKKYANNTLIYLEAQSYIEEGDYDLAIEVFKSNGFFASINCNYNSLNNNECKDGYKLKINLLDYQIDIYSNSLIIDLLNEYIPIDYEISYELEDAVFVNDYETSYTIESLFKLPVPVKDGYVFKGWLDENSILITNISPGRIGNITLKAVWQLMEYTISYNLNGGTNSCDNPIKYTIEDNIILNNPNKDGYLFIGWYYKNELVERVDVSIKQSIEIEAKWEPIFMHSNGIITGLTDLAKKKCSSLTIPSSIDGNNITEIGDRAFYSLTTLYEVTISNGINVIGDSCFFGCPYLSCITINASNLSVKNRVFENCMRLKTVIINGSIESVGEFAFANCVSLNNIDCNRINYSIGKYAFMNCNSLEVVGLSNTIVFIGERAFYGCSKIDIIEIPNKVEKLSEGLFANCTSLWNVKFSKSIRKIEGDAFYNCTSLVEITFKGTNEEYQNIEFVDGWNANCSAFEIEFIGGK